MRKTFKCLDLHCGGEPARILYDDVPHVEVSTENIDLFVRHDLRALQSKKNDSTL